MDKCRHIGELTINDKTFTDNGWTILAQIRDFAATFTDDPLSGNDVYQILSEPTLTAVLTKLAQRATNGALQKWSQAFYRLLSA